MIENLEQMSLAENLRLTKELTEKYLSLRNLETVRKKQNGLAYYVPNKMQYKAHQSKASIILYCGGNRAGKCLGSETKIYDPVLGKEVEVGKIKSDFHVLAFDGQGLRITTAIKPFKKTIDKLYEIKLSNGGKFTASKSHVVLTPDGFHTISDVRVGTLLFLPQTILEPFQSAPVEDGQNSYRKVEDSQSDYRSYFRLCDGLLHREVGSAQVSFPLQHDAQVPSSSWSFSHTGVQGNTLEYSHSYQPTFRLSNSDGQVLTWVQHDGTLSDVSYTTSISAGLNISSQEISCGESSHSQSSDGVYLHPKNVDSNLPLDPSYVVVTSISYIRDDYKWDFTVPVYHNYFASGCIHHNSTFGAVELAMHITKNYPSYVNRHRRAKGPIKALVVATSNAIIEKVIEPKVWMYLPKDYVTHIKRITGGYLSRLTCKDGSTVDFLSNEQDDMSFESADYDFYWGDEPQKRKKFQGVMRGLIDRGGKVVLTFTPLVEPWMKEELVDRSDGNRIETFTVDMRDNCADIEGNPILSEENIKFYTSTWTDDEKETRLHGKFFHLRGQVYTEFSEVHQIEFDYTYPDPVIAVLDPHDRQPHHVIWAIIDRQDDVFVHSEMSVHCTVDELARRIRGREKAYGYKMKKRLIDPNFGRKPLITTGRNMIQELALSGCPGWFEADDPKEEGRLKVKDYLHYDKSEPISFTNKPKLYFHKSLTPLTIHSIRNHQYEEWIGKLNDDKDPKEKTKDKETHGADCVRYLCMSNPTFDSMRIIESELDESPY